MHIIKLNRYLYHNLYIVARNVLGTSTLWRMAIVQIVCAILVFRFRTNLEEVKLKT